MSVHQEGRTGCRTRCERRVELCFSLFTPYFTAYEEQLYSTALCSENLTCCCLSLRDTSALFKLTDLVCRRQLEPPHAARKEALARHCDDAGGKTRFSHNACALHASAIVQQPVAQSNSISWRYTRWLEPSSELLWRSPAIIASCIVSFASRCRDRPTQNSCGAADDPPHLVV